MANKTKEETAVAKRQDIQTASERFVTEVQRQFAAEMGSKVKFSEYERTLAQHLFAGIDTALKALDAKREESGKSTVPAIIWQNINLQKLALDAVHRINLGLDALIPNHIHPIPYWNSKLKKYDLDLRIGYKGKEYCHQLLALVKPKQVIYHLVHENDHFKPIMKDHRNKIESYEFDIQNPFDRGKVIGGFGYIEYDNPELNKLILIKKEEFDKAKAAAKTNTFWAPDKWEEKMQYKTIVHRVNAHIPLDPAKLNAKSYAYVEAQEAEEPVRREIAENANQEPIDADYRDVPSPEPPPEENMNPELPAGNKKAGKPKQEGLGIDPAAGF